MWFLRDEDQSVLDEKSLGINQSICIWGNHQKKMHQNAPYKVGETKSLEWIHKNMRRSRRISSNMQRPLPAIRGATLLWGIVFHFLLFYFKLTNTIIATTNLKKNEAVDFLLAVFIKQFQTKCLVNSRSAVLVIQNPSNPLAYLYLVYCKIWSQYLVLGASTPVSLRI